MKLWMLVTSVFFAVLLGILDTIVGPRKQINVFEWFIFVAVITLFLERWENGKK